MTKRIFKSICIVALVVFFASLILFMGVLYDYFSGVMRSQLRTQTELAAQGALNEGARYFEGLDMQSYRVTWISADGTVLYDSRFDTGEMENHLQREEIQQALTEGVGESSRYSVTLLERHVYCARRLDDGTVLRLSVKQNTMLTLVLGMLQPVVIIFVVALILSLVLASRLSKGIVKPLNELNLDEPLGNEGYDELMPLLRRIAAQKVQIQRQQEKLEQTDQLRREFTANVSHELKTPLHTISGSAELLANGIVKAGDVQQFSQRIYSEAQRMICLVEDIIKLSHLDEGAEDMKRENVDLYALAGETMQSIYPEAKSADVSLTLCGQPAMVYGIRQLLQGIVFNLCDNAIKYNSKGGLVTVTVDNEKDMAVLTVADTGIGIPPEHQERVFERFYRVDKSHSKEIGGTGLGLSIVKHAAKLHNAAIEIQSEVGAGTTVRVCIPVE